MEQLSVRILPETQKAIGEMSKVLGINSEAMMIRLLLEASVSIINDSEENPGLPPIMAASRGAMRNGLPKLGPQA